MNLPTNYETINYIDKKIWIQVPGEKSLNNMKN